MMKILSEQTLKSTKVKNFNKTITFVIFFNTIYDLTTTHNYLVLALHLLNLK